MQGKHGGVDAPVAGTIRHGLRGASVIFIVIVMTTFGGGVVFSETSATKSVRQTETTVTTTVPFGRALERADEVWLAGLFFADGAVTAPVPPSGISTDDDLSAVYLRWAPDNSLWIPRWDLQLAAPAGWWPERFVTFRSGGYDIITLAPGLAPRRDHTYTAAVAYDETTGTVSFALHDHTAGTEVFAGHVELTRRPRLVPVAPLAMKAMYDHVADVTTADSYSRFGLPLDMGRAFSWQWVLLVDGKAVPQGAYRFGQLEQPGVQVTWPAEFDRGTVSFHVYQDGQLFTTVTASPRDKESVYLLAASALPRGDAVVHIVYNDGTGDYLMEETPLRIVGPEIRAAYKFYGRDNEANGRLDVVLYSDTRVPDMQLTLVASLHRDPAAPGQVQQVVRSVTLPADESVVLPYTLPLSAAVNTLSLRLETTTDVALHGSTDTFKVAPMPLFQAWPIHDGLTARLGDPAVIRPGDAAPKIGVYAIEDGTLHGTLWHDGRPVQELARQPVAAETTVTFALSETPLPAGHYELRLQFNGAQRSVHFAVLAGDAEPRVVYTGDDGTLYYTADYLGNKIADFSYAGYGGGGVSLPDVPVQVVLQPEAGDATARVQAALDAVGNLPANDAGRRGAVLLRAGTYEISETLRMDKSGVVLRGEGSGTDGTVLIATGRREYDLIAVGGARRTTPAGRTQPVTDMYVPVGGRSFHVADAAEFNVGDTVAVRRHGNAAWIQAIGMDRITPRPTDPDSTVQWTPFSLTFERVITHIEGNRMTVDAPLLNAIEAEWGGGDVTVVHDQRVEHIGVEHIRAVSRYDETVVCQQGAVAYACDEAHAQYVVAFGNVKNAWLSNVVSEYFAHGPAELGPGSKWVTVQDARSLRPVSTIEGGKRYPFHMQGQLNLMQRLFSEGARHAFVVSSRVTGPNVFLHAESIEDHAYSEPHHRWSVGGLYDNVASTTIAIQDRQYLGTGHGWSGANYVTWNTTGTLILQRPPTAHNWSIGHAGVYSLGAFEPKDPGYRELSGQHGTPQSLYLKQLSDRLATVAIEH